MPTLGGPGAYNAGQVDLIWEMGLASLESNDGELVIPASMQKYLNADQVEDLKSRLRQQLGGPIIAFMDEDAQVFRIMRIPALKSGENSRVNSPARSGSIANSSSLMQETVPSYKRKAKIPRPPNAFILYRQEHHPKIKFAHPEYHNNDISVVLGKQWKSEPEAVKARYRSIADKIKTKHMEKYPDYQYAPRKTTEKKRRMTARKRTEIVKAQATLFAAALSDDGMSAVSSPAAVESQILGVNQPMTDAFSHQGQGVVDMTLPPTDMANFHEDLDRYNGFTIGPVRNHVFPLPANTPSTVAPHVQNAQSFADSLIDWDQIHEDFGFLHAMSDEENTRALAGVGLGHDWQPLSAEDQHAAFEAELHRTMELLK